LSLVESLPHAVLILVMVNKTPKEMNQRHDLAPVIVALREIGIFAERKSKNEGMPFSFWHL